MRYKTRQPARASASVAGHRPSPQPVQVTGAPADRPAARRYARCRNPLRHDIECRTDCRRRPARCTQRDCPGIDRFSTYAGRARRRKSPRQCAACSWHSDGTRASARNGTCRRPTATGGQRRRQRSDRGQLPRSLEVGGAAPQTVLISLDRTLQLLTAELRCAFARSSATEDTAVFAIGLRGGIFITSIPAWGHGAEGRQQVVQQRDRGVRVAGGALAEGSFPPGLKSHR